MNPLQTLVSALLILISVFAGFQVDRWWEEQREHRLEVDYLERLLDDFRADRLYLQRRLVYFGDVRRFAEMGLEFLSNPEVGQGRERELVVAFYLASHAWDFNPSTSTFQELKSAGALTLIRDTDLRNTIAIYYQDLGHANYVWQAPNYYRRTIRSVIPADIQRGLWLRCHEIAERGSKQRFLPDCTPDFPATQAADVLQEIRQTSELQRNLNFLVANTDASLDLFTIHLDNCEALIARVSRMLESRRSAEA